MTFKGPFEPLCKQKVLAIKILLRIQTTGINKTKFALYLHYIVNGLKISVI